MDSDATDEASWSIRRALEWASLLLSLFLLRKAAVQTFNKCLRLGVSGSPSSRPSSCCSIWAALAARSTVCRFLRISSWTACLLPLYLSSSLRMQSVKVCRHTSAIIVVVDWGVIVEEVGGGVIEEFCEVLLSVCAEWKREFPLTATTGETTYLDCVVPVPGWLTSRRSAVVLPGRCVWLPISTLFGTWSTGPHRRWRIRLFPASCVSFDGLLSGGAPIPDGSSASFILFSDASGCLGPESTVPRSMRLSPPLPLSKASTPLRGLGRISHDKTLPPCVIRCRS